MARTNVIWLFVGLLPAVVSQVKREKMKFDNQPIKPENAFAKHGGLSTFSFIPDDGLQREFVTMVKGYDEGARTFTFLQCLDEKLNPVCYYPTCIGKCGGGCGNDEAIAACTEKDLLNNRELGQGKMCKTRCLNHDLCQYAQMCPGSVKMVGDGKTNSKKKKWSCYMTKLAGAVAFNPSQVGTCPIHFRGYTSFVNAMTLRQKINATGSSQEDFERLLTAADRNTAINNHAENGENSTQVQDGTQKHVPSLTNLLQKLRKNKEASPEADDQEDGPASPGDLAHAESVIRKVTNGKKHAWVMFMGDSNMRNTYQWWIKTKLNRTSTRFMKSKQFMDATLKENYGKKTMNAWSDQEALMEYADGFEIRTSLRFLHGSSHEFKFKTLNWKEASMVEHMQDDDKLIDKIKLTGDEKEDSEAMDDPDAKPASQFAKFASKRRALINFKKEVPGLAAKFENYDKPDVVVLTEGWGGIPGCSRFQEVLEMFKRNPEVKFVWSPIFVTNRIQKRHDCFAEKIAKVPLSERKNFQFVDLWDMAQKRGLIESTARTEEETLHIGQGSHYMKVAASRFEDAIEGLAK